MLCQSQCASCPTRKNSPLSMLDRQSMAIIDQGKVSHFTKPKEILFFEGDPSNGLYCVSQGRVKLYKTGPQGHRKIIHISGPGEMIGYRSILANDVYQATAECMDEGRVCLIRKDQFQKVISNNAGLALAILEHLAKSLGQSQINEFSLAHKHIDQRFAQLLMYLIDRYGVSTPQGVMIDLPLSRQDIADFIGSTQESAIRIVTSFKKMGILVTNTKKMVITDLERLTNLVQDVE